MTNLPANYEHVNHPKHYGSHPSKIETIDVIEHLSFNLGTAFKYVMRRDDKSNAIQDLNKALWYLKRIRNPEHLENSRYDYVMQNLDLIIKSETNAHAKLFYQAVAVYLLKKTPVAVLDNMYKLIYTTLVNLLSTYK